MRFLYVTDLHGWQQGYEAVRLAAVREKADFIVNGGDLLPNCQGIMKAQKWFIQRTLPAWLELCRNDHLNVYMQFGNDDLACRLPHWREMLKENRNCFDISAGPVMFGKGISLIGFHWVPDYPFRLKDWCLLDSRGWQRPPQRGTPIETIHQEGFSEIMNIDRFFAERPSIDEALCDLPKMDWPKTIFVCHCPPFGMELGRTSSHEDVGSRSVRSWIERTQPLLCLHGHFHEGPSMSGIYSGLAKDSLCVQPGQERHGPVVMALIDITDADGRKIEVKRLLEEPNWGKFKPMEEKP